jgi:hypothetical protein
VGVRARRLAVLTCLFVPPALHAQLAAVGVPAGVVRVDLDGSMEIWDHRWRDGTREPLAADLTSPALGSDLLPTLADADARVGRITGQSGYRLDLGALSSDAQAEDTRGYMGLALGLTRKITVFGRIPLVQVRTEVHYAVQPTPGADGGLTPGTASQEVFFQQFDASLAGLGARIAGGDFDGNPALKAQAQSTLQAGTALRDDLFGLLADPSTLSPFVPIATSQAGQAIDTRVTDLQATLANDFGVSGFSTTPSLPDALATTEQLVAALSDFSGLGLRPGGSKVTFRGDAEAGLAFTLVDRWDRSGHHGGFRTAVEGLVRFPTGRLAQPDRVLGLGTGDGQTDLEARITTDLGAGRWGLRAEGTYNRQLAADYIFRVAPPTQPLAGLDRLSAVHRDPGDIVSLAVRPFFRLTPTFALQGLATYWSRGTDQVSYLTAADEIPGVDASVLAQDSKATASMLGFGVTYSSLGRLQPGARGLPIDASWSYERVVRSTGGIVPDRHVMRARFRFYFGLF